MRKICILKLLFVMLHVVWILFTSGHNEVLLLCWSSLNTCHLTINWCFISFGYFTK